jgi:acetyl-CoA carboxylase biotin carboxyl carrier protein
MTVSDAKFGVNGAAIKELAEILNSTGLSEIEYEDQGCRIRVAKSSGILMSSHSVPGAHVAPAVHAPAVPHAKETGAKPLPAGHIVRSPMVGTAYLASEPGAANFVKPGDRVNAGQTLLIIEAMKVMNPIKATQSGVVREVMVLDAAPVEFDEPLIVIE